MSSRIRILLMSSLAANLVLLGLIIGHELHQQTLDAGYTPPPHEGKHHRRHEKLVAMQELVAPEHRQLLENALKDEREKTHDLFPEIQAARETLREIMVADQFDADAFKSQLNALDALHAKGFRGMGGMLLKILPELSREERVAIASFLREHRPNGPPPHEPPPEGFPPPDHLPE